MGQSAPHGDKQAIREQPYDDLQQGFPLGRDRRWLVFRDAKIPCDTQHAGKRVSDSAISFAINLGQNFHTCARDC